MRAVVAIGCALLLAAASAEGTAAQTGNPPDPLPIDLLLEISSVLGGETPVWSPDGSRILFSSGLSDSGLMTIDPRGGFPVRVPAGVGTAGHFLASSETRWSPDGKWISFISSKSGSPELWLWSVADGQEIQLTDLGGRVNSMSWSPDGTWIAFADDRYGNYDIWRVAVPEGDVQRLTHQDRYEVFPTWTPDSKHILYVRLDERWADHEVLEMPASGGESRLVVEDTDFFDYGAGTKFGYPRVSPDGQTVLFPSHRSGWINYWVVPRSGGEPRPIAPEEADQTEAKWSPDGQQILYISNHNGTHELRVIPASGGAPRTLVAPQTGVVAKPEWSPDGTRISYTLETPTTPEDLYVVSVANGQSTQLTHSMPAGQLEEQLVVPEKITYPSTDGLTISAYLYKPVHAQPGERFPGILWIHGGPTSQFNDTFQQHVQFFVQRGYVVLLPNIRGSSGYGKAFEDANNPCWGHCDLEDVRAGVEYLKTLSYVDAEKMGITGTSYGGIMSMTAVAFAPGLFQAAIPQSGYSDWVHFYHGENELRHIKLLEYEWGPFEKNQERWRHNSAITGVANVTTPVLLIHGAGRYPPSDQSEIFAKALEKNYKVFRYKTYSNEHYYVSGRVNRKQMLLDMQDFFDQFLKNSESGPT